MWDLKDGTSRIRHGCTLTLRGKGGTTAISVRLRFATSSFVRISFRSSEQTGSWWTFRLWRGLVFPSQRLEGMNDQNPREGKNDQAILGKLKLFAFDNLNYSRR